MHVEFGSIVSARINDLNDFRCHSAKYSQFYNEPRLILDTTFQSLLMGKVHLGSSIKIKTDLILLDVMMPRLDGFEVCKRLKGNPEVSDIPFIFIKTIGIPKDVLTGFKSGERSITSPHLSTFKRCVSE